MSPPALGLKLSRRATSPAGLSSGFAILNVDRAPVVTLMYRSHADAAAARSRIEADLVNAVEVVSHCDPSR